MTYPLTFEGRNAWLIMTASLIAAALSLVFAAGSSEAQFLSATRASVLFPYAILLAQNGADYWNATVLLVTVQFPLYASVLVIASLFQRGRIAIILLLIVHGLGILLSYLLSAAPRP